MVIKDVNEKSLTEEEKVLFYNKASHYFEIIKHPVSPKLNEIPFIGRCISRYNTARMTEAIFFTMASGDPVVDQKMLNAIMIRDYEMKFGLWSGLFWGSVFAFLPGLKGYTPATRIFFFAVPFSLAYYRSFRRGYDQINYVGMTYLEIYHKKRALLKYLGETEGYLSEFKEAFMKTRNYESLLEDYGIEPYKA